MQIVSVVRSYYLFLLVITNVFVGSTRVQEKLRNFTDQVCPKEPDQLGYKTFFEADLAASNSEGELTIPVPEHELQVIIPLV